MSYLTQAQDPRRRAAALSGTIAINVALGLAVVTGLTITGYVAEDERVPILQFPTNEPPEAKPEPTPEPQHQDSKITAPPRPIELVQSNQQFEVAEKPKFDEVVLYPDPAPTVGPDPLPASLFTPRRARPSNHPSNWVTNADYTANLIRNEVEGTAGYRLVIGTDGRVSACEVTRSSGNAQLDAATCRHIQRRARFEAATDDTGAKVVGTYAGSVKWQIPD